MSLDSWSGDGSDTSAVSEISLSWYVVPSAVLPVFVEKNTLLSGLICMVISNPLTPQLFDSGMGFLPNNKPHGSGIEKW